MYQKLTLFVLLNAALLLSGCSEDGGEEGDSPTAVVQGWHFQGRDCLACHNVDLGENRHLLIGGTLYKSQYVTAQEQDNLDKMCGGNLVINFYDVNSPTNLIYSSKTYEDTASKGYKAKGNLFILQRKLALISQGDYFVEITDANGNILSTKYRHSFSAQPYDSNNPQDNTNALSCNACHSTTAHSKAYPIYVDTNTSYCQ